MIWLLLILVIILISLITFLLWHNLENLVAQVLHRRAILKNLLRKTSGLLSLGFIFVFFIEQAVLLILSSKLDSTSQLIIGLFALIVITTSTVQKLFDDIKSKYEHEDNIALRKNLEKTIDLQQKSIRDYRELIKNEFIPLITKNKKTK